VTVVDAVNFMKEYRKGHRLCDRSLGAEETDERSITQLLVDQVECANLIVLNKMDLVKERNATHLEGLLRKLNPKAKIIHSSFGRVDVKLLLNTRSFDMAEAEQMPGWYQELQGNHVPETLEYNISSFVFRAQRPFHPRRLDKLLANGFDGVLRSKGVVWIAGIHESSFMWNQAGDAMGIEDGGAWLHGSEDPSNWPSDTPQEYRSAPYGDRRQELVFIGKNLKAAKVRKHLNQALVTDAEFEMGSEVWAKWSNPFRSAALSDKEKPAAKSEVVPRRKKKKPAAKSEVAPRRRKKKKPAAGSAVVEGTSPAGSKMC